MVRKDKVSSHKMAGLISVLLFVVEHCAIANGFVRIVKTEYIPYGPLMCKEMCNDSMDLIIYTKKELSCRRIIHNISKIIDMYSSEYSFTCLKHEMMIKSSESLADIHQGENCDKNPDKSLSHQRVDGAFNEDQNYDRVLHQACKEGKLCMVQYILSKSLADINCRGKTGQTPVMVAARSGQTAVFDFLVTQNCNMMIVDDYNDTLLHAASQGGNAYLVTKLTNSGKYDIESRGRAGYTPLFLAAASGHREAFDFFRSKGCNPRTINNHNNSILHMASAMNHVDLVKHILSLGIVDIDSKGINGYTPVMFAARMGMTLAVEFLVSKGCNLTSVCAYSNNILHLACMSGNISMVQLTLSVTQNILNIDSRGRNGLTPVMMAGKSGHRDVVELLVSKGCNVTAVDDYGRNILHLACRSGNVTIVQFILSVTQDRLSIDSRGQHGMTPMMVAGKRGYRDVVELLASNGCSLRIVDDYGNNILHQACLNDNIAIVEYLITQDNDMLNSRGPSDYTPVMMAARQGHIRTVEFLVGKGCNLTAVSKKRLNLLHVACINGSLDIVAFILSQGIVGRESTDIYGGTPVIVASSNGHKRVVQFLVSKSCNVRAVDFRGNNVLHAACTRGNVEMVKYLLAKRFVDVNARNNKGMKPVQLAQFKGYSAVVALFKAPYWQ